MSEHIRQLRAPLCKESRRAGFVDKPALVVRDLVAQLARFGSFVKVHKLVGSFPPELDNGIERIAKATIGYDALCCFHDAEFDTMKTHVDQGLEIVHRSSWLKDAIDVVGSHHEKYDGSGYPQQLQGEKIPIGARIFAITDVFDALTSRRPYKEPFSFEESIQILEQGRGTHFDPGLLDQFARMARDLHARYGGREDEQLREELTQHVQRYFTAGLDTLVY